jgi:hypothetical protein
MKVATILSVVVLMLLAPEVGADGPAPRTPQSSAVAAQTRPDPRCDQEDPSLVAVFDVSAKQRGLPEFLPPQSWRYSCSKAWVEQYTDTAKVVLSLLNWQVRTDYEDAKKVVSRVMSQPGAPQQASSGQPAPAPTPPSRCTSYQILDRTYTTCD